MVTTEHVNCAGTDTTRPFDAKTMCPFCYAQRHAPPKNPTSLECRYLGESIRENDGTALTRECQTCKPGVITRLKVFRCHSPTRGARDCTPKDCLECKNEGKHFHPLASTPKRSLILHNNLSPGDILVMTAAIESLHMAYPGEYLTDVRSPCPALFEHNRRITHLDDGEHIETSYPAIHQSGQRNMHFMGAYCEWLGDRLGIKLPLLVNSPAVYVSAQEKSWINQVEEGTKEKTRFWLVNAGTKKDFTAKGWGHANYQAVVNELRGSVTFVQVGEASHLHKPLDGVINLLGKTDLRQLIRLAYHAVGGVGPSSFLMHLFAALEKPYVLLSGGREPVPWQQYHRQHTFHTIGMLDCCPSNGCWKSRTVPLNDGDQQDKSLCCRPAKCADEPIPTCMEMILPADVAAVIANLDVMELRETTTGKPIPVNAPAPVSPLQTRALSGPKIVAYMMTCPARAGEREQSAASFKATDWPGELKIIQDASAEADPRLRMAATAKRLLETALGEADPWEWLLFLEDDVLFNRHLYFNLANWLPVKKRFARVATLYSPSTQGMYSGEHFFCYEAALHGGSQAMLLRRDLVEEVLASWDSYVNEMQDVRIAKTASRVDPLMYVYSPSLVQHRPATSTWGGKSHESPSFDPDFKLTDTKAPNVTHVKFMHGLGDCANAAHLFALYNRLGHPIAVECTADKAPLFQAAGCAIAGEAKRVCAWEHPGEMTAGPWQTNKTAWNVSRNLPDIGSYADRWAELCNVKLDLERFVSEKTRRDMADYLATLPRPIIALHTKGNTSSENKNYPEEFHAALYHEIIERTGGTLLLLDWDSRISWFHHYHMRHMLADGQSFSVPELYEVIKGADCFVGIDSGPLHLARFTDTPGVGIWIDHFPSHFALPSANIVHHTRGDVRHHRFDFRLIQGIEPAAIAKTVQRIVQSERSEAIPIAMVGSVLDKCRTVDNGQLRDRDRTFRAFLERLPEKPLIVETGCIRAEEDWSAGYSTYFFGHTLKHGGGRLVSIDNDAEHVAFARKWTDGLPVEVIQSDSRDWLRANAATIDGLYLDSADTGTPQYQEICLEEARAALTRLSANAPILIDDTPYTGAGKFGGKGALAIPWLVSQGYSVAVAGYQVLLTR